MICERLNSEMLLHAIEQIQNPILIAVYVSSQRWQCEPCYNWWFATDGASDDVKLIWLIFPDDSDWSRK